MTNQEGYLASDLAAELQVPRTTLNDWLTRYAAHLEFELRELPSAAGWCLCRAGFAGWETLDRRNEYRHGAHLCQRKSRAASGDPFAGFCRRSLRGAAGSGAAALFAAGAEIFRSGGTQTTN